MQNACHSVCGILMMAALVACNGRGAEPPAVERVVKVEVREVQPRSIASSQRYSAVLDAAEGSTLGFAALGRVKQVHVREGQWVKAGTLLAELDNEQAASTYAAAKALLDQAQDGWNRAKPLYEKEVIATVKWVEIETKLQQAASTEAIARRALDDTRLTAPFDGYVADLSLDAGQQVAPGLPVLRVVNTDRMKVDFAVPEREVSRFAVGMPLRLTVGTLGGCQLGAEVAEVGMVADRLSRTYRVSATLPNPDHQLRVGMLAEVWLVSDAENSIPIPSTAVQLDADGSQYVWVVRDGRAAKQRVLPGLYLGDSVTVEGLGEGSLLIVKGQQKVSNGMKVVSIK